jgi:hypothetical protein
MALHRYQAVKGVIDGRGYDARVCAVTANDEADAARALLKALP